MTTRPQRALAIMRRVADEADDPDLAARALLQMALIHRVQLMDPRRSLEIQEEYLARPGAAQRVAYARVQARHDELAAVVRRIDALLERAERAETPEGRWKLQMEAASIYNLQLSAPSQAFVIYARVFEESDQSHHIAYYMMGHTKMQMNQYGQAVAIFEDFRTRFPESYLFWSATELIYRSRYLQVFHRGDTPASAKTWRQLDDDIRMELEKEGDEMPEGVRQHLEYLRTLIKPHLK